MPNSGSSGTSRSRVDPEHGDVSGQKQAMPTDAVREPSERHGEKQIHDAGPDEEQREQRRGEGGAPLQQQIDQRVRRGEQAEGRGREHERGGSGRVRGSRSAARRRRWAPRRRSIERVGSRRRGRAAPDRSALPRGSRRTPRRRLPAPRPARRTRAPVRAPRRRCRARGARRRRVRDARARCSELISASRGPVRMPLPSRSTIKSAASGHHAEPTSKRPSLHSADNP